MNEKVIKKTLRLNEQDASLLKEKSNDAGMNENDYLRILIRAEPIDMKETRNQLKALINEVNHIGVNINQIARNTNAGFCSGADKIQLMAYMQKLNTAVEQVVKCFGNQ